MRKHIKSILHPLRKAATRFILKDEEIAPFSSTVPIDLAANYTCAEGVEGDYLEFGCFRGDSFIRAYNMITSAIEEWSSFKRTSYAYTNMERAKDAFKKVKKFRRRFIAFDSFDGLPEIEGVDNGHPHFAKGRYDCTETEFRKIISRAGVKLDDVVIVPGFYENTLHSKLKKDINLEKAAIVMIDCDLYTSTKMVLNFITDLISDGTIIIFDDWFSYKANPNKGEQKACNEWLEKKPEIHLVPYVRWGMTQMSFIVNRSIK